MKPFFTTLSFLLLITLCNAQVFPYTFSVDNQPYQDLEGGTDVFAGEVWDDEPFEIDLGFTFPFFLDTVTVISQFGLGADFVFEELSQIGTAETPLFFPLFADYVDRGYLDDKSLSPVTYLIEGDPGNRILKLEYENAGFYGELFDDDISSDFVNFQIWLFESGDLEIRIGDINVQQPLLSFDELPGFFVALVENATFDPIFGEIEVFFNLNALTGPADNPTLSQIDTLDSSTDPEPDDVFLTTIPVEGTVYRFERTITSSVDIQVPESFHHISIFPNPAQSTIHVQPTLEGLGRVVDINGRVIWEGKLASDQLQEIHIADWPKGIYFLHLSSQGERFTNSFLKN